MTAQRFHTQKSIRSTDAFLLRLQRNFPCNTPFLWGKIGVSFQKAPPRQTFEASLPGRKIVPPPVSVWKRGHWRVYNFHIMEYKVTRSDLL